MIYGCNILIIGLEQTNNGNSENLNRLGYVEKN